MTIDQLLEEKCLSVARCNVDDVMTIMPLDFLCMLYNNDELGRIKTSTREELKDTMQYAVDNSKSFYGVSMGTACVFKRMGEKELYAIAKRATTGVKGPDEMRNALESSIQKCCQADSPESTVFGLCT